MPMPWIALVALGAVGLYLCMPGGRANLGKAGLLLLIGAGAALVSLMLGPARSLDGRVPFVVLSLIGLVAAVRVITHQKPVYSALYFILVIIAVAGLLVLMQAEFLSVALVMIYAGAILVTYVFVIMLASQSGGPASYDRQARDPLLGVGAGLLVLAAISSQLVGPGGSNAPADGSMGKAANSTSLVVGDVATAGTRLMTTYAVGVEVAGVLLLAAMVGAIAIAQRKATEPSAEGGD